MKEEIVSVGIDIGTSTTQLVFSRITLENLSSAFAVPRISIVDKEVIYRSEIYFTPLKSQVEINGNQIRKIIKKEYNKANISPSEVSTGAVIITGETARKKNASLVSKKLSGLAGDFVVATAGPDLESIIAAKGAGVQKLSKEKNANVLNLDIGGGTTNIALFSKGEVVNTACLDIGGRLIKFSDNFRIDYLAPKIKELARNSNLELKEGQQATIEVIKEIANRMTTILEEVVGVKEPTKDLAKLLTKQDLKRDYEIDYISFSGGVADYIYRDYDQDLFQYGDLGIILGQSIRKSKLMEEFKIHPSSETIRATVVGAGSHTTDISGSTITYVGDVFPLKNIPILKLTAEDEALDYQKLSQRISKKVGWFSLENGSQQLALAIKGVRNASFKEIQDIARSIIAGMEDILNLDQPLIVIVEHDIAKALGQSLYGQLERKKEIVCIDSVAVKNGDYIDIGKPLARGKVLPVIIKTLVFDY